MTFLKIFKNNSKEIKETNLKRLFEWVYFECPQSIHFYTNYKDKVEAMNYDVEFYKKMTKNELERHLFSLLKLMQHQNKNRLDMLIAEDYVVYNISKASTFLEKQENIFKKLINEVLSGKVACYDYIEKEAI
jgi:hypothetical protein